MSAPVFETWATYDPEYRNHRAADEDRIRAALEAAARLIAEYDEDRLRPPSFVTIDLLRDALTVR